MWAMEMHPDDRPQTVKQLEDALNGLGARPARSAENPWLEALSANWVIMLVAAGLLVIAVALTLAR